MTLGQTGAGTVTLNGTTSVTTLNASNATTAMTIGNNSTTGGMSIGNSLTTGSINIANGTGLTTGAIGIGAGSLVRGGAINIGTGGTGGITIGNTAAPLSLNGSTIAINTGFKPIYLGSFILNTSASGYSPNVTLPALSNGYYLVITGSNFNDPNTLVVVRVTIGGGVISSAMMEIGNAYNSFGARLGSWSSLTFTITGMNYPSNYTGFNTYYLPICVF